MKLSVEQIHEMYPDDQIKKAFFDRADIRNLPPDEQGKRWELHKVALERFIKFLSILDGVVI